MGSAELRTLVDLLRTNSPLQGGTLLEMRAGMEATSANAPRAEDVRYEPVDAGGVPGEWITAPESDADRVVVYFHGGGYVMGSIDTHRALAVRIARANLASRARQ